jgi:hypothetical protein
MTIQTLMSAMLAQQPELKLSKKDYSKIGHAVMLRAKQSKVRWTKVEEIAQVNDFPESFADEMREVVEEYLRGKGSNHNPKK